MRNIDGQKLKEILVSGANNLYNHYPEIDQLNVFPVPDGDTGMNMNLTLTSGVKSIAQKNDRSCAIIASNFSTGLLMGARGNSGVITSQIFRGIAQGIEGKDNLNTEDLSKAFLSGSTVAYKAVPKPVEGTILTVIRESSAAVSERIKKDTTIEAFFDMLVEEASRSLEHTPELLPILKEVGVVDSGGAGLLTIFRGMREAAHGNLIPRNEADMPGAVSPIISPYAGAKISAEEEGFGYCTQMTIRLGKPEDGKRPFIEKRMSNFLNAHGNSVVMVRDGDIVKIHVHTLSPGTMLNYAQNYGEFVTIVIENMTEEHDNISHGFAATDMESNIARKSSEGETPLKEFAIIAVSSGSGIDEMFKELGVDVLVSGGQTMNPSTQDFIEAIKKAHAKKIFILPNNSNIVMAASQACEVSSEGEVSARVVPSKTIVQGFAACMQFSPENEYDETFDAMKSALKSVISGSITYAIKDTDIEGVHITKGHYMAMKEEKAIVSCVADKMEALYELCKSLTSKGDIYVLTVICGEDVTPEERNEAKETLTSMFPDIEVDVRDGEQPVYSFLVGAE